MFLLNSRLGLFTAATLVALLLPKLRSHFAEFLNNAYLAHLRILSSSTCVGLRYGCLRPCQQLFSPVRIHSLLYFFSIPVTPTRKRSRTSLAARPMLGQALPSACSNYPPVSLLHLKRPSSVQESQPVVHRLRPSSPQLRSRLTLGGRAFPRKPQTFDGEDSHLPLATHANILSPMPSTTPFGMASVSIRCSSTDN